MDEVDVDPLERHPELVERSASPDGALARRRLEDGKLITRISCDYPGVLGFEECQTCSGAVAPSSSFKTVLSQNGRAALRARV